MALEQARADLLEAVEFDKLGDVNNAVKKYLAGIDVLMLLLNDVEDVKKVVLRKQISDYMTRVESLKAHRTIRVEFLEQLKIEEGTRGHSYESIFSRCLDERLSEVIVEDPYIILHHQISNFVIFCELLLRKCENIQKIRLITGRQTIQDALEELKRSLSKDHNVDLSIEIRETLHDREIRFDNGWIVKIGRGLDLYKPHGKYSIGAHDYQLRPCKKTTVDIFKTNSWHTKC